jgi:hypothetical protein
LCGHLLVSNHIDSGKERLHIRKQLHAPGRENRGKNSCDAIQLRDAFQFESDFPKFVVAISYIPEFFQGKNETLPVKDRQ